MDAEQKKFYFRVTLIILGWAGICGLLYFFVLVPLLKEDSPPNRQNVEQPTPEPNEETPPTVEQQPNTDTDTFEPSVDQAEIDEAQKIVDKFVQVIYEGNRSSRDQFVNQLKPYTTEDYLSTYKQANGLGEPIKIKEKHIDYIEHGSTVPDGWIGFNCTVLTEEENLYSTIYFLSKQNGTWRVTEEADSFVPEE